MRNFTRFFDPVSYYVLSVNSLDEFVLGMLSLGTPIEMSLVGVFDTEGRGSRRDIDLPLHQDGKYSKELADVQGGYYVEKPDIDIVGLYCIKEGSTPCYTIVNNQKIDLKQNQVLVFDNNKVMHGRKGQVGDRILVRMWVKRHVA